MSNRPAFTFGDIVTVDDGLIGIVIRCRNDRPNTYCHEVYVRTYNEIRLYTEKSMCRYEDDKEIISIEPEKEAG